MRAIVTALCAFSLIATPVVAQEKKSEEKKAPTAAQKKQQARMKDCNEKVGDRKGDDRKKFMSACLKGDTNAKGEKMTEQQSRMKDCNKKAGDQALKGDERKKFMSTCLKG